MSTAMPYLPPTPAFIDRRGVTWTTLAWMGLLTLGICMVASATANLPGFTRTHLLYLFVSLLAFATVLCLPLNWSRKLHQVGMLAALVVASAVVVPGIGITLNGATRWVSLGLGTLQVSEVAKPLVVVYMAGYLERFGHLLGDRSLMLFKPLVVVGVLCGLLVWEPDFGGAFVIGLTVAGMLFIGGGRIRHFLMLSAIALVVGWLLVQVHPHAMARMTAYADPTDDPYGSDMQLLGSLFAFGRSDIWGRGLGESVQKLGFLPEMYNDFIFAVTAEELGLPGVALVMLLFLVLVLGIWRRGRDHLLAERRFAGYLCYGTGLIFALQFLVHVGVCTGSLPTKGLTLPFVSYGGNSLLFSCMLFAMVLRGDIEAAHEMRQPVRGRRARRGT
ncbi:MAG: cell division protein FtsW [Pseudomonadales bacterium]|nr:cell division protein FtsW [Pseudomonadales bacterium]MCP5185352.1 cell division protein FtsW [Pseudomonadales bacterium]